MASVAAQIPQAAPPLDVPQAGPARPEEPEPPCGANAASVRPRVGYGAEASSRPVAVSQTARAPSSP